MAKIIIIARTSKTNPGEINVRFRLRDGRSVDITHGTEIKARLEDLDKFQRDGRLKPKVSVYNRALYEEIRSEIDLMEKAYQHMLDRGMDLNAVVLDSIISEMKSPIVALRKDVSTLVAQFRAFIANALRVGIIGDRRASHVSIVCDKLERFLIIKGLSHMTPKEFDDAMLLDFREFLYDEYLIIPKYVSLYRDILPQNLPKKRLSSNTVVSQLKMLQTFFLDLEFRREIDRSPFRQLSRESKKVVMRTKYNEPVYLRADEFEIVRTAKIPKCYEAVRDTFVVHCAFGCRISDFQRLNMSNISVSKEGIPYIHYLPQKTADAGETNAEVETPIVRFAFDIIQRNGFRFPIARNAYGNSGYNVLLKELLKECGINRSVPIYDEDARTNTYRPLYEVASTKLARKTHVDMLNKVQIDLYAAGLHRQGSSAIHRYTSMEIKDRFALINLAFSQKSYCVREDLSIIYNP